MTEKMKPSGIEWIGDVPTSWQINKIKYCTKIVNGSTPESSDLNCWDGEIKWITPADMENTGVITNGERTLTKYGYDSCGTTMIPKGSIVISSRAPIGKINITGDVLCTNQGCKSLVREMDNRYLYYLLLAGQEELVRLGRGTTFIELSTFDLANFEVVLPEIEEQVKIADFLDDRCTKIDSVVADIKEQIVILQKYKKSLTTETVTKGLDKTVPMKDSGIEWIGKIPVTWNVQPIKYYVDFYNGDRGENYPSRGEMFTDGVPFINAGHLLNDGLDMDSMDYISEEKYKIMGGVKLQPGDILYCLRGSVGKNAIINIDRGTVASSLVALRSWKMNEKFLYFALNSYVEETQRLLWDNGTAQPNLSVDNLRRFKICIPSMDEQEKIVKYLAAKCANVNDIIMQKNNQLDIIRKHKKSLIYEYVTGKKRVMEVK